MRYDKRPLPFTTQIDILKNRGLHFGNEDLAKHYLSNISYYRLRAYTYPFQDNNDPDHPFITSISFEEIVDLYVFDRRLRLLVFNALEKIEIALRTKIIYHYAMAHGSHFHENPALFRNQDRFHSDKLKLQEEIKRSSEDFIKHYFIKYSDPPNPPAWMSLEVVTMGLLSQFYKNFSRSEIKRNIARAFGLPREDFLENWMHVFSNLRNICAHHGRIWNRRFIVEPRLPANTSAPFLTNTRIHTNKLYASLSCMQYILKDISPGSDFSTQLKNLLDKCPLNQVSEMGFPGNWKDEKLWQDNKT
jgi:abortive infection bacteriophage resistance protein